MTMFQKIKAMDIDEFAEWLDENDVCDSFPWVEWFDKTYCKNCEPEIVIKENTDYYSDMEFGWCELNNRCKFFPEFTESPTNKQVIKMWLEREVEVEVVRCKDCKHLTFSDCYGECGAARLGIVRPDDFCSRGERKV